jgi:hypothetical protein
MEEIGKEGDVRGKKGEKIMMETRDDDESLAIDFLWDRTDCEDCSARGEAAALHETVMNKIRRRCSRRRLDSLDKDDRGEKDGIVCDQKSLNDNSERLDHIRIIQTAILIMINFSTQKFTEIASKI